MQSPASITRPARMRLPSPTAAMGPEHREKAHHEHDCAGDRQRVGDIDQEVSVHCPTSYRTGVAVQGAIDNNARALKLLRDSFSAGEGTFRDLRKSVRAERTGYVDKVLFTACSRNSQGRDVETAADLVRTGRGRR